MNISLTIILFALTYFLLNDRDVSCKGRGGGSRGGGSRGGGSRSGGSRGGSYRSGSSGYRSSGGIKSRSIVSSSRYSSWSIRVGVQSGTRYRVSPWETQHRAILAGHIIMSSHQRSRFHSYDKSYYDDISVCYNEEPLYQRNVTASPWFICPWEDLSERFCCGDEVEERCCRYFERTWHKVWLMIGITLLMFLLCSLFFCYKRSHKVEKTTTIVYVGDQQGDNKSETELAEGPLLVYPPVPINSNCQPTTDPAPPYTNLPYPGYPPSTDNNLPYPGYPPSTNNNLPYPGYPPSTDNNLPYSAYPPSTDNNLPNASYSSTLDGTLPYPVNATTGPISSSNPHPINEQMMTNIASAPPMGNYSSQSPPSYEDALKIKN